MPGVQVGVYPGQEDAGTQVSSTYEGRHITVREDELIHPYHADGFVDKGDPVVVCDAGVATTYGNLVGVALASGSAAADWIALDTEGIWNLLVYAVDDAGNSAIEIGDCLYIRAGGLPDAADADGTGDAEISKMNDGAHQVFFGYALGSMVAGGSGQIAVKLHCSPFPEMEETRYHTCADGAYEYGHKWVGILAAGGQSTGVAASFTAQVLGTQDGHIYGWKAWTEPGADYLSNGSLLVAGEFGIWDGQGGDITNARICMLQMQAILAANPSTFAWYRLNLAAAGGTMDYMYEVANPTSIGYIAAVTEADAPIGYIPFANIVGVGTVYIRVYADTD